MDTNGQIDRGLIDKFLTLGAAEDVQSLRAEAVDALVRCFGGRGSFIQLDGQPQVVLSTDSPSLRTLPVRMECYPEFGLALESDRIVAISDVHSDPQLARVRGLLPAHLKSVIVVPLCVGAQRIGVLVSQSNERREFKPEDIERLATLGHLTAQLLEGIRLRGHKDKLAVVGASGTAAEPQASKGRILLIEDDPDHAEVISWLLTNQGYEVSLEDDGARAVHRAMDDRWDLLLLDVGLPSLDGFGVTDQLTADPRTRELPILFLSGSSDLVGRVRRLQRNEVDFITKPVEATALVARIELMLAAAKVRQGLRSEAHTDELTGLGNLRLLQERMDVEQARWRRNGSTLSIAMIDLDRLKEINDRCGHAVGSETIAGVARVLKETIRETDLAVRYGGDEFVVLLPDTTPAQGQMFLERVLARIRLLGTDDRRVTVSAGLASNTGGQSIAALLEEADAAAYRAKRLGRDRACVYDPAIDARGIEGALAIPPAALAVET